MDEITSRREFFPAAGISLLMLFLTAAPAEAALSPSQRKQLKKLKKKLKATRRISDPARRRAQRKKIIRQIRALKKSGRR